MARIAGVDIPNDKQLVYSLRYIYGIGLTTAKKICLDAKVEGLCLSSGMWLIPCVLR